MIVVENIGVVERRYSDQGVKIRQIETNTLWNDAIDVSTRPYTYEETNIPCDPVDLDPEEVMNILLGRDGG